MHVLHVFNVIKATNTLSEKNLGCRFVEQVVTQKRTFFWRILFKALIHLEYDICLLLDAQSTSILIQFHISRKFLANFRKQQRNDASTFRAPVS